MFSSTAWGLQRIQRSFTEGGVSNPEDW
jgi:CRISPR/Cas system-associated endoribonuclease Cas2